MDYSNDPAIGHIFRITVDGQQLGVFTKVDGLNASYDIETVAEGGENGHVHRLPGRITYENVRLTRPIDDASPNLAAWFSALAENLPGSSPTPRSAASITAYGADAKPVMTWNLREVLPVRYRGPSFQAGQPAVLTETIELAHNGFTSTTAQTRPSGRSQTAAGGGGASPAAGAQATGGLASRASSPVGSFA